VNAPTIVSVILPTVAVASRAACLGRALQSVFAQESVRVDPIVVANGLDCDHDLLSALGRRRDIRLVRRREGGLAAAITAGRELVDAPYFAELDDDDFLLPGALAAREARMEADRSVDAVGHQRVPSQRPGWCAQRAGHRPVRRRPAASGA